MKRAGGEDRKTENSSTSSPVLLVERERAFFRTYRICTDFPENFQILKIRGRQPFLGYTNNYSLILKVMRFSALAIKRYVRDCAIQLRERQW